MEKRESSQAHRTHVGSGKEDESDDEDNQKGSEMKEMRKWMEGKCHCRHVEHLLRQMRESDEVMTDKTAQIGALDDTIAAAAKDS